MEAASTARKETIWRQLRGAVRSGRKTLRSLPKRIRNARQAFALNTGPTVLTIRQMGPFQVAFRSGSADESVLGDSFDNDVFFSRVPEYVPGPTDTILDVGAHIGTFSLLAASKAPQGKVYAIEACEETCHLARLNVGLNQMTNVDVSHLALAGEKGTARLFYNTNGGNWGHTITKDFSRFGEEVATDTLANFFAEKQIAQCEFAKFNCEGAEFSILLNTPPEVLRRIGMMLVLYHCDLAAGYRQQDLIDHLGTCGFSTQLRNQGRNRGWIVARQ